MTLTRVTTTIRPGHYMLGFLRRHYLSIDPRTLGLLRIAIACLLLVDLVKRVPVLRLFYVNAGLIPNHRVLWRPPREHMVSLLLAFGEVGEVQIAFVLIALVYLCLLIGYRTRLMHVLAWLSLVSLQTRADVLSSGADFVFSTMVLWSAFLPLGRRFSVDAVLDREAPNNQPVVSLAVLALTVQLAVIYFFNTVHKDGPTWREGTAVYWLVHQERIVTWLGYWARESLPLWAFQALTYVTLVVEGALPLLILSPWGRPWTRRIALLSIFGLHTGMALMSNLGLFSPVMMVYALCFVETSDWEWWARSRLRARPAVQRAIAACHRSSVRAVELFGLQRTAAAPSVRRACYWLGELTVLALIMLAISQVLVENRAIPAPLRIEQPRFVRGAIEYLRLNQGWSMFAPDAPMSDLFVVIDAVTSDGRHIDPWNDRASRISDPSLRTIPARLDQDAAYCDYSSRVVDDDILHEPLRDWIFNHHRRTHRPEDRIEHFKAYAIEQDNPAPGERAPSNVRSRVFLRY
ncbi:MAG TPA: HTTM domain-containing protein [Polyangiales bacterium]|nr:HTTM domain-containing protein [Polyangiales bacterium]